MHSVVRADRKVGGTHENPSIFASFLARMRTLNTLRKANTGPRRERG
jgi:hypothetical protein